MPLIKKVNKISERPQHTYLVLHPINKRFLILNKNLMSLISNDYKTISNLISNLVPFGLTIYNPGKKDGHPIKFYLYVK